MQVWKIDWVIEIFCVYVEGGTHLYSMQRVDRFLYTLSFCVPHMHSDAGLTAPVMDISLD
jgi:hypothetical protein